MKQEYIEAIRDFNRFYAKVIGALDKTYLNGPYSLAEARVMRELFLQPDKTANDILAALELDKGYLSRILKSFEKKNMIAKKRSDADGRNWRLNLTETGQREFAKLDRQVIAQVEQAFSNLNDLEYKDLIEHMKQIIKILNKN